MLNLIIYLFSISFSQEQIIIGEGLYGNELMNHVIDEYKPSEVLSWEDAKDTLYATIDLETNNQLTCVYTGYSTLINVSMDPSSDADANGINAEHTFPQSMGAAFEPMKSDMHNLYPVRADVNSSRNNSPFYDISDDRTDVWFNLDYSQNNIPDINIDEYSEKENDTPDKFEPREVHKGNASRSIFYFYTMYNDSASSMFFTIQKHTLKNWHYMDEVDMNEYERTYRISQYQDNKPNPFILDSTLARRIWFYQDPSPAHNIVINELHYNPSSQQGADNNYEFIELYNAETFSVNLYGYHFIEGLSYYFSESTIIEPAGYLILVKDANYYPGNIEWSYGNLSNVGEMITLVNSDGLIASELVYDSSSPFPNQANGEGPSMELLDPVLDNSIGTNWQSSLILGGTPGSPNSVYTDDPFISVISPNGGELWMQGTTNYIYWSSINFTSEINIELYQNNIFYENIVYNSENNGTFEWDIPLQLPPDQNYSIKIVSVDNNNTYDFSNANFSIIPFSVPSEIIITEIMQNPSSVSDANGEWIEIYNASENSITINGWIIQDNGTDQHVITAEHTLSIDSEQYFVLGRNSDFNTNGGINIDYQYSGITLANSDDEIIIFSSDGITEVDRVEYDGGSEWPDPTGASMALIELVSDNNIGSNWEISTIEYENGDYCSPGSANNDNNLNGDVNQDSIVNVLDIIALINIIFDSNEYNQDADLNIDGIINVLDIIYLVNLILS